VDSTCKTNLNETFGWTSDALESSDESTASQLDANFWADER